MTRRIKAWHFLPDSGRTRWSDEPVEAGTVLRMRGPLELCRRGYHGSRRILNALRHARGSLLCRTEHRGTILRGEDKLCSTVREALWTLDATEYLQEFMNQAAEYVLARVGGTPDPRSLAAIAAKRAWLRGEIDNEELDAAWQANSWVASGATDRHAARVVAWATERFVAGHVAGEAAGVVAGIVAWDAAWGTAWVDLNEILTSIIRSAPWEDQL